jgi:N,N'-diacetyllegionaminate synthase
MKSFSIDGRLVGPTSPPYIIAEIGFNHGGDLKLAKEMIAAASFAGADAVKFQTYRASDIALKSSEHFESIAEGELSLEEHKILYKFARSCNITFLSTPFSKWAVDLLEETGVSAYKIASMDLTNTDLLEYVAQKNKPIILSTGMGTDTEIRHAIDVIKNIGNTQIAVLHCISNYPTSVADANLRTIKSLQTLCPGLPVGFSDHLLGTTVPLTAIALGAAIVEKHFTTDKTLPGPDHSMSASPTEMKYLVDEAKSVFASLGRDILRYHPVDDLPRPDRINTANYRRSMHAITTIEKGETIVEEVIKFVRPGNGVKVEQKDQIIGHVATRKIVEEEQIVVKDVR